MFFLIRKITLNTFEEYLFILLLKMLKVLGQVRNSQGTSVM